jgi:hypothetical protein
MLNETSPILNVDNNTFKIKLKQTQKALIYKTIQIEHERVNNNGYPYAIINSIMGMGKTYSILAHIYFSITFGYSKNPIMIVVTNNIYSQWMEEINNFYKPSNNIKIKYLNDNLSITELQREEKLKELNNYNIILITYNDLILLQQTLMITKDFYVSNIFFDECSIVSSINSIKYNTKYLNMVWFVSASISKQFLNESSYIGIYQIDKNLIHECLCCPDFVKKCMHVKELNYKKFTAKDFYIDKILVYLLPITSIQKINAHSFNIPECYNEQNESTQDILKNIYKHSHLLYHSKHETLEETEKKMKYTRSLDYDNYLEVKTTIEREIQYYKKVISILKHLCIEHKICVLCFDWIPFKSVDNEFLEKNIDYYISECSNLICRECVLNMIKDKNDILDEKKINFECFECHKPHSKKTLSLKSVQQYKNDYYFYDKFKLLSDVLNICRDKTIIFSEHRGIDKKLTDITLDKKMDFIELNSGNIKDIKNVLDTFKNTKIQILFISDINFGVGLNLEFVKNIIFFHKVNIDVLNQVVGRAQRYGRISQLNVYELNYKNEC